MTPLLRGIRHPYLESRNGIWTLRVRVPPDVQLRVGLREFRRSLRTDSFRKARQFAAHHVAQLQELFEMARDQELTGDQIATIARRTFAALDARPPRPPRECEVAEFWRAEQIGRAEEQAASGAKDRTACNLVLAVDFDRDRHQLTETMAGWRDDELAAWALDLERPLVDRMAATWMLAGTKRFPNINAPEWNERPRDRLMSLMVGSGMPLVLCYIADRAAIRGGGCMHAALLPMWQVIQQDEAELCFLPGELPDDPGIGQLLSAAYDMHTRQGQAAIIRLMTQPDVSEALAQVSPADRRGAMFEAVFAVEGGRLSSRASSPQIDSLTLYVDDLVLAYSGVRTLTERKRLLTATAKALPELHRLRRGIVLGENKSA